MSALNLPPSANRAPAAEHRRKEDTNMFGRAFPDLKHAVDEMIAEGSAVAARWTVRGTHQGEFQGIAPTGKAVRLSGSTLHHITDGKIRETWLIFDSLDLLRQIGALPSAS